MDIRVRLGPIPSVHARAWLGYARRVLDAIGAGHLGEEVPLRGDMLDAFRRYLDQWDAVAGRGDTFEWTGVEERDVVAAVATAMLELLAQLSGRFGELGLGEGPPEGEPFYHHLVAAVSEALAGGEEQLGEKLQEAWPALGRIERHREPRRIRVVIADDAFDLRMVVKIALEQDGRFEVVGEASDGSEAIDAAMRHQPDIVLLDLVMPGVDGWTALKEIVARCPETRVVVVSTLDAIAVAERARASGAAAYVQKSISLVSLTETLAELPGVAA